MKDWINTRESYIKWLSKSELRKEFSKKIYFENLSLWWISELMSKDNIVETQWYYNLNKRLNLNEKISFHGNNYLILSINLFKKLFYKLISTFLIKIFFFKKEKIPFKRDAVYGLYTNFIYFKNSFIDRQYGNFINRKSKNKIYVLELPENFYLIKNIFRIKKNLKKIPIDFVVLNKGQTFTEIFKIFFYSALLFFKLQKILKKKNYFMINKIDCRDILEPKLKKSFFGPIQDQLYKAKALENILNNIETKNFINCYDFYYQSRAFFHFSKNARNKKIININHAIYFKNDLTFGFNSIDFSQSAKNFYSPKPDIFFTQGEKYYKYLNQTFHKKNLFVIGSLKAECNKFKLKKQKLKKKKNSKKNILILCGINDYESFIKIINDSKIKGYKFFVAPHPLKKKETIKFFNENLKTNFIDATNIDKNYLFLNSDYIICGDTSLGYELALKKYNVLRLYDKNYIPTFDVDFDIPTAKNRLEFNKILKKRIISQKSINIERKYFYKYDMRAHCRLENILNDI